MILIAGATGFLGREVCRRVAGQGLPVRGLVRPSSDPNSVAQLREWGVELRDYAQQVSGQRPLAPVAH